MGTGGGGDDDAAEAMQFLGQAGASGHLGHWAPGSEIAVPGDSNGSVL